MKVQDIVFVVVLITLIFVRRPKVFLWAGIMSWLIAIPLFACWVFFTAERLTWYGACFVLLFLISSFVTSDKVK